MDTISYTAIRKHLVETMNRVCEDHAPVIITRQSAKPVVMLSLEDYEAYEETFHLLKSPANAARLLKAVADDKAGKLSKRNLLSESPFHGASMARLSVVAGRRFR